MIQLCTESTLKEGKSTAKAVTPTVLGSQTFPQRALQSEKSGQREIFLAASESQQSAQLLFPFACYDQRFFEDLKIRLERSKEYQRIQKSVIYQYGSQSMWLELTMKPNKKNLWGFCFAFNSLIEQQPSIINIRFVGHRINLTAEVFARLVCQFDYFHLRNIISQYSISKISNLI